MQRASRVAGREKVCHISIVHLSFADHMHGLDSTKNMLQLKFSR
ncbi:hypothetical protein OKW50_008146 [Paraburkholderia youngii]